MDTSIIRKITLVLFFILSGSTATLAQQPLFKVYAVSGKVKVLKPGEKYRPLKVTDELLGNETLKVDHGAVVNLVCSSYIPVQVAKGGTYKVVELSSSCKEEQTAFYKKYFEYVWNELFHKHAKPEAAPLQSMKNKGAVSRGCPGIEVFYPVDTLKLVTQNWQINWNASGSPVEVTVHDSEFEGMQLYKTTKANTSLSTAELTDALAEDEISYLQLVPQKGATCARYPVIKSSKDAFHELMNIYFPALPNEKTSSYYFMRSLVEEEHKYLGEALHNLNKAIALEPANSVYKNHLALFKAKYNLR